MKCYRCLLVKEIKKLGNLLEQELKILLRLTLWVLLKVKLELSCQQSLDLCSSTQSRIKSPNTDFCGSNQTPLDQVSPKKSEQSKKSVQESSSKESKKSSKQSSKDDNGDQGNSEEDEGDTVDQILEEREQEEDALQNKQNDIVTAQMRHWMIKHGKGHFLDFSDEETMKLKECFDQLDEQQKGSISELDLYDPLIGLGFAENMSDVAKMVEAVDDDGSGQIEFPEFLMIIKGREGDEQCAAISKFFKGLSDGEFSTKAIMFTTYVNQMRRNYLLDATRKKAPELKAGKEDRKEDFVLEDFAEGGKRGSRKREKTKEEKIMENIERYLKEMKSTGKRSPAGTQIEQFRTLACGCVRAIPKHLQQAQTETEQEN